MKTFIQLLKKEVADYFLSPIAYIVICIFLIITGWFFFSTFFLFNQAGMRSFFALLPLVFAFVIPAVTMRLFSEELHSGSFEILLTLPLTLGQIIAGKFAAGVVMTGAMLAPTLAYPISISFIGDLDWGPVIGGYIGALLLGGSFAAVGLLASAITRNQIIAFILGAAICLTLTLLDKMLFFFPETILNIIEYIGADAHFQNVARGVIDSRDLVYFISVIFIGLLGTHTILLKKQ